MTGPGARPPGLDRPALVAAVHDALRGVLPLGARAGVAVSGGPDSVALAVLACEARPDLMLQVLHVRHGLRDDADDARVAEAAARHLGLPFAVRSVTVRGRGGPEAAARRARLGALREMADEHGLVAVLVGHTADDQAETVLLHLVRGSGLAGAAGMRAASMVDGLRLVRPLLHLRRTDVRRAVGALETATDPSNADPDLRRVRARTAALPALAALAGGPGDVVAALTRLAALAADDDDLLDDLAEREAAGSVVRVGRVALLPTALLAELHPALARRVVRSLLRTASGAAPPAAAVERVRHLAEGAVIEVHGRLAVAADRGWLVVGSPEPLPARALPARGALLLPELDAVLSVTPAGSADVEAPVGSPRPPGSDVGVGPWLPEAAHLPVAAPPQGWRVRGRRGGDALPLGGLTRAVRDLQRAAGAPAPLRSVLPVIVDAEDRPVWLPGIASSDRLAAAGAPRGAGADGDARRAGLVLRWARVGAGGPLG